MWRLEEENESGDENGASGGDRKGVENTHTDLGMGELGVKGYEMILNSSGR